MASITGSLWGLPQGNNESRPRRNRMLYFALMYIGAGTLLLLLYSWHEYTEGAELVRRMAESTVDGAKEEAN